MRLRGTTFWVESAEAAQLGPLAQGLCSYAQRFTTTLEAISKSAEEVGWKSGDPELRKLSSNVRSGFERIVMNSALANAARDQREEQKAEGERARDRASNNA